MKVWTALLAICVAAPAGAQGFQEIVETGQLIPGLNVEFDELNPPVFDGTALAFRAQSYSSMAGWGIFRADAGGSFAAIATRQTQSPAGGTFSDFGQAFDLPSIHSGVVAFIGLTATSKGVFSSSGEALDTIVTGTTDFPDTDVVPFSFDSPSLSDRVAVTMTNVPATPYFSGVYSYRVAQLFTVVDTSLATFGYYNISNATTAAGGPDAGVYVYEVNESPTGPYFVYRRSYQGAALGDPEQVVASGTQRPDGASFFSHPSRAQVDRTDTDQLCFLDGSGLADGVYRANGSTLETVADTSTSIPDGTGNFTDFGYFCAIDAGDVAFIGRGSGGQQGVYIGRASGALEKVVDTGDTLGGATPYLFDLSREALSNGRLAFVANAAGGQSIWVTPEADAGAAALVAALAIALLRCVRLST